MSTSELMLCTILLAMSICSGYLPVEYSVLSVQQTSSFPNSLKFPLLLLVFLKSCLSFLCSTAVSSLCLPLSLGLTAAFWLLVYAAFSPIPNFLISSANGLTSGSSIAFCLICPLGVFCPIFSMAIF